MWRDLVPLLLIIGVMVAAFLGLTVSTFMGAH